jgi:hypothetical protein
MTDGLDRMDAGCLTGRIECRHKADDQCTQRNQQDIGRF